MAILVTGGAGYIGSHTCIELLNAGYEVVVMDNLYNASEEALRRVEKITGKHVTFYKADMLDREAVNEIFEKESIDSVIHFAGLKAVGESVAKPLEYYHNNITGTLILCDVMRNHGVKKIIFSSSVGEAMILGAMAAGAGYADRVLALASSHFASAERQFRFPLAYGNQRPQSTTWTVTGCGCVMIEGNEKNEGKDGRRAKENASESLKNAGQEKLHPKFQPCIDTAGGNSGTRQHD